MATPRHAVHAVIRPALCRSAWTPSSYLCAARSHREPHIRVSFPWANRGWALAVVSCTHVQEVLDKDLLFRSSVRRQPRLCQRSACNTLGFDSIPLDAFFPTLGMLSSHLHYHDDADIYEQSVCIQEELYVIHAKYPILSSSRFPFRALQNLQHWPTMYACRF